MELGGTWVHPLQPNVWAEITRYGIGVIDYPIPGGRQAVLSAGRVTDLSDDDMARAFDALAKYCAPGAALFAAPYSEVWGPDPERFDERSMREHLASLQLPPLLRDAVDGMISP